MIVFYFLFVYDRNTIVHMKTNTSILKTSVQNCGGTEENIELLLMYTQQSASVHFCFEYNNYTVRMSRTLIGNLV